MKNQIFKAATLAVCIFISDFTLYAQEGGAQSGPNIQPLCNSQFTFEPCMNLVRNPSFSIYVPGTSPVWDALHNISGACPWTTAIKTNPAETHTSDIHAGTPNVFHQDITYASNSVPANFAGSSTDEVPNTVCGEDDQYYNNGSGNIQAYTGLYGYATTINGLDGTPYSYSDYREFIQQKLSAQLTAGKTYTVNIRVKLGTNSNRAVPLGILFSPVRPDYPAQTGYTGVVSTAGGTLLSIPAVSNKTTWQTVTFSYTHTGAPMQYITIGNFKTDAQLTSDGEITTVPPSATTGQQVFAYYYIDDIAVFETGQVCCQASSNTGFAPCAYPTVNTLQPQIGGSENGCAANTYTVLNAGQYPAGTLFTWTYTVPGGTPVTGSGTSFSLNASQTAAGGLLTLTATPPYGCPAETKLQIKSCCVPDGYTGNNATTYLATGAPGSNKASDMLAHFGGTVPFYAQIAINGLFTVDVDLSWVDVDARFGPDAKVVLDNNRQFNINRSHLYACDKMWQGIEADHISENVNIFKSLVEHAYVAVNSISGADIYLSGNTFNRNQTHVGVSLFTGVHPAKIDNNVFTCEDLIAGTLLPLPQPLQNQHTGFGISAFGVGTLNIGIDPVGGGVYQTNYFRFASTHVMAVGAGVNIKNCNFTKMLNWQAPTLAAGGQLNVANGVAVCAYGPTGNASQQLSVGGFATGDGCYFEGIWPGNNIRGAGVVTTDNIHVSVAGNSFKWLKYGVAVNKLTGWQTVSGTTVTQNIQNLNVKNNNFYHIDSSAVYGVDYQRASVSVTDNIFESIWHKGIYFGNIFPSKFTSYLIQNNDIKGETWTAGIHTINCSRTRILNNHVGVDSHTAAWFALNPRTHYGIRTEGCGNVQIIDNKIDLDNTTPTAAVFNNSTYLKLQGINVAACPGATVCNNEMQTLGTGMRFMLNNAGIRIRLNKMFSLHTGMNLYQANIQNPGISTQGDDKASDNQWNNILGGNTSRRIVGEYSASFDYKYRSQSLPNQSSVPAGNWNPQNFTELIPYVQGVTFTKTVNNSTQFVTCTGQSVASIEELSQMRQAMFGDIVDGNVQYEAETEEALKYFDEKTAYTELKYDSALWAGSLQADDKFRNFVEVKETENIGRMGDVFTHVLNADKAAALQVLATINPATDVEGYEKTVADIYIRRWMNDTASFDSTEIEQLGLIANMDYETGGPAVLAARVLLGGDALDFETKSQTITDDFTEAEEPTIQIYPNPVSDVIGFRMMGEPEAFTFRLFTMQGMVVLEQQVKEGELHTGIGVHHLMKGVYFYEIQTRSGKLQNGKLIVITN